MTQTNHNNTIWQCTAGGTVLSMVPFVRPEEVFRTVLLAATGATVSFILSVFLNYVKRKISKGGPQA